MDIQFVGISFFRGIASILDLGATSYTQARLVAGQDTDFQAINSDWAVVGGDLCQTILSDPLSHIVTLNYDLHRQLTNLVEHLEVSHAELEEITEAWMDRELLNRVAVLEKLVAGWINIWR